MFGRMLDSTLCTRYVLACMVDYMWGVYQSVDSTVHHTFEHLCSTVHSINASINGSPSHSTYYDTLAGMVNSIN
jgi:hypothetical protein